MRPHLAAAARRPCASTAATPAVGRTRSSHGRPTRWSSKASAASACRWPTTATAPTSPCDLGLPVVLVVGLRLGCLNHALLTAEAIRARGLRARRLGRQRHRSAHAGLRRQPRRPCATRLRCAAASAWCRSWPRPRRPSLRAISTCARCAAPRRWPPEPDTETLLAHGTQHQLHRPQGHGLAAARPSRRRRRGASTSVAALFELPFNDLLFRAQQVHRAHFDANDVQLSTLLSIKTGGCAEDCGYCPQSGALRHRREGRAS